MGERNGKVSPRWASLESGSLWIHEKWPEGLIEVLQDSKGTRLRIIGVPSSNFHFVQKGTHVGVDKAEI